MSMRHLLWFQIKLDKVLKIIYDYLKGKKITEEVVHVKSIFI